MIWSKREVRHWFMLLFCIFSTAITAQNSFPGAEGFGSVTRGAYQNTSSPVILYVDTLAAANISTGTNSGSFEWCITRNFPRIILFKVGGTIDYRGKKDQLSINQSYCSIYGQTAPYPGIILYGTDLSVSRTTHDVIMQHFKIRPGDQGGYGDLQIRDCFSVYGYNVILDHCSLAWSSDELLAITNNTTHHITISNCLLSHPLQYNNSGGADGFGPYLMADSCVSFVKNIIAYARDRSPRVQTEKFAYINNYSLVDEFFPGPRIYDPHSADVLHHVYMRSISAFVGRSAYTAFAKIYARDGDGVMSNASQFYFKGNICPRSISNPRNTDWQNIDSEISLTEPKSPPLDTTKYRIIHQSKLIDYLLDNAGAFYWNRDYYDKMVIDSVRAKANWAGMSRFNMPVFAATHHVLKVPANPHVDDNNNGFTRLEEWVYGLQTGQKFPEQVPELPVNESSVIYIDPGNISDADQDGSIEHPFDSWKEITWKSGKVYLQKSGTVAIEDKVLVGAGNITLGSYGDGEKPVIQSSTNNFAFTAYEKSGLTFSNLHIKAPEAVACIYFLGSNSDNNVIENCTLEGADNGIRMMDGKNLVIRYCTFQYNDEAVFSYAENTDIYYNIFRNNSTGIRITSNLSTTEIYNNVFCENLKSILTAYSNLKIFNNIFYMQQSGNQAIKHSGNLVFSDYNIFYPEQAGFVDIAGTAFNTLLEYQQKHKQDLHSYTTDPLFKNILSGLYTVLPNSPAIDAGNDLGLKKDFYGMDVPAGGAPDIGLAEAVKSESGNDETETNSEIIVYPNPSTGRFFVRLSESVSKAAIEIRTLTGKLIMEFPDYSNTSDFIDMSSLPKGIYLISLVHMGKAIAEKVTIY
ncbi:MAG: right-handed parallel beta-helix repeat-containing protein [Bacteroidales bacterium]|nr:right-handed parallel beta-helix repeat-containing protein [Bacteroidales bacterium]